MKKLINCMPLINRPRTSANRTNSPRGRHSTFILNMVAVICFGFLPMAYAGSPSLEPWVGENLGSGNSAAENVKALINLTSGVNNTATGVQSLFSNTAGNNNTASGFQSLLYNTTGSWNVANGDQALANNSIGSFNTAIGSQALFSNTTGSDNTATGRLALAANTTGNYNTANGSGALSSDTSGYNNTAVGFHALFSATTGGNNTAVGTISLSSNTEGAANTAIGYNSLVHNTAGSVNTAIGGDVLRENIYGSSNTGVGYGALRYSNGGTNTAVGTFAMNGVPNGGNTGFDNAAVGYSALYHNTSGSYNTAIGDWTLNNNLTGTNNVGLGEMAGYNQTTGSNNIYIGTGMRGVAGESNTCYIGSIWNQTASGGTTVVINNAGKLGTLTSSRRFKRDIKPMNDASETLFALKPVTFRYKTEIDPQGIPQFGLIAEEVEKVNPDLVVRDKEGKVNTVRYEQINAMLLNEFLKEHKKVEALESNSAKQEATISALRQGMGALTAQLKEQAAQIQKVSAHIATNRPDPQVVANH